MDECRYGRTGYGEPDDVTPIIEYEDIRGATYKPDQVYSPSREQLEYEESIRRRIRERRRLAERRRVRRNRTIALILLAVIVLLIAKGCSAVKKKSSDKDKATDSSSAVQADKNLEEQPVQADSEPGDESEAQTVQHKIETIDGITFVDDVLIVNKTYSVPSDYAPGQSEEALNSFYAMSDAAAAEGISLYINSGYRSYWEQADLYNSYANERGTEEADKVSSRPGHSEHQTGLAFDVNTTEFSFEGTPEALWLAQHCAEYGFIIRFPKGKEAVTGYDYEPWHIRYLGVERAKAVTESGLCLEEYLGVTSRYEDSTDQAEGSAGTQQDAATNWAQDTGYYN